MYENEVMRGDPPSPTAPAVQHTLILASSARSAVSKLPGQFVYFLIYSFWGIQCRPSWSGSVGGSVLSRHHLIFRLYCIRVFSSHPIRDFTASPRICLRFFIYLFREYNVSCSVKEE